MAIWNDLIGEINVNAGGSFVVVVVVVVVVGIVIASVTNKNMTRVILYPFLYQFGTFSIFLFYLN